MNHLPQSDLLQQVLSGFLENSDHARQTFLDGMASVGKAFIATKVAVVTPACIIVLLIASPLLDKVIAAKNRLLLHEEAYGTVSRERLHSASKQVILYTALIAIAILVLSTVWVPFIIAYFSNTTAAAIGVTNILNKLR